MNRLYFCHNAAALPGGVLMDEEIVVSLSSDTEDAVSYPNDVLTVVETDPDNAFMLIPASTVTDMLVSFHTLWLSVVVMPELIE